uniref:fibrocystin-L-like n=1 Tax=Myxine glutinosa TaxID=7769 RepID=UPI00358FDEC6
MECSRISTVLLALCFVSHIQRLTCDECNDICLSKCPLIPVYVSENTCATECAWLCGSKENCDATSAITMREGCFYNSLLSYLDDDITKCPQLPDPPVLLRDPMRTCFNLNYTSSSYTSFLDIPSDKVKSCLLKRTSGITSLDNEPLLNWVHTCTWEIFLKHPALITAALPLQFPAAMNSHCAIRRLLCSNTLNLRPVAPSMFGTAVRAKWSSHLTWLCLGRAKPQVGDTVVIPKDVWLLVDESTPALKDIVVHGVLALDPNKTNIVLTAEHITIKNGSLVAGSISSPFTGQARVIIKGNAASAHGIAGAAAGIGVYGQISIHAAIPSPVHVELKEKASAGTKKVVLSKDVHWKVGDKVVLSTTTYGPEDTEVNEVEGIVNTFTLSLKNNLAKSHTAVSLVVDSSPVKVAGVVGVLSRHVTFEFTGSFSSTDAEAWVYVGRMDDSVQGKVHIAGAAFSFPSDDKQPKALFADINAEVNLQGNTFTNASGGTICFRGDNGNVMNNLIYNTQLFGIRVEGKSCRIGNNLVMMSSSNPDLSVYPNAAAIDIVNASNIVTGNKVAGFKRVAYRFPETPCSTASTAQNEANGGLYGVFVNKGSTSDCISVSGMYLWKCWNSAIYVMTDANVVISNVTLADNMVGITTTLYNITNGNVVIKNSKMIGSSSAMNCDNTAPTGFSAGQVNNPPHTGGRAGILWPVFAKSPYVDGRQVNYSIANGAMAVTGVSFVNFGTLCADKTSVFVTNPISEDFQHQVVVSGAKTTQVTNMVYMLPRKITGSCGEIECDGPKTTILYDSDGSFLDSAGDSVVLPVPMGAWPNESLVPRSVYVLGNGTELNLKSLIPNYGYHIADYTEMKEANAISCSSSKMALLSVRATDFDFLHRIKTPVAFHGNGYLALLSGPPFYKMADCQAECNLNISWYRIPLQQGSCYNLNYRSIPPQRLRFKLNAEATTGVTVTIFYSKLLKFQESIDGAAATDILESKTASCEAGQSEFNLVTRKLYVVVNPGQTVHISVKLTVSFVFVAKNITKPLTEESVVAAVAKHLNVTVESISVRIDYPESRSIGDPSVYVDILIEITGTEDPGAEGITTEEDFLAYARANNLSQNVVDSVLTGALAEELGIEIADMMVFESLPPAGSAEWNGMMIQEMIMIDSPFIGGIHSLKIITFPGQVTAGQTFKTFIIATDSYGKCVDAGRGGWKVMAVLKNAKGKPVALLRGTVKIPFRSCWANFTNILITTAGSGYSLEFIVINNQQFFTLSQPFVVEEDRGSFARNIAIYVMEGVAGALAFATVGTIGICHRRKRLKQQV